MSRVDVDQFETSTSLLLVSFERPLLNFKVIVILFVMESCGTVLYDDLCKLSQRILKRLHFTRE